MATIEAGYLHNAADMSASLNGNVLDVADIDSVACLQIDSPSNTRAGTLYPETSNDGATWTALAWVDNTGTTVTSIAVVAASVLSYALVLRDTLRQVRVRFADSTGGAGAGALTVLAHRKRV